MRAFLLSRNLEKSAFMGTNSVYFYVVNIIKLLPYGMAGQIGVESLKLSAVFFPAVLLGVGVGVALHRRVSQHNFTRLAYGFLGLTGLKLLWDAITAMI